MSRNKSDLVKNTLILGVGRVFTQLISFIFLPLYTLYLTPKDFGIVDLVLTYVTLLAPLVVLRLDLAAFRFLIDARGNEKQKRKIISNSLQITIVGTVLFGLVYLLASLYTSLPHSGLIFTIFTVNILLNVLLQIARGLGDNTKYTIASIVTGLAGSLIGLLLVIGLKWGINGVLWSMISSGVAGIIYLFFSLKLFRYAGFCERDAILQKELIRYSLPLVPSGISWWAINAADRTIIAAFLGVAATGIYAVSAKFAMIFGSIYSIFSMSWMESASVHINGKDRDAFFSEASNASVRLFGAMGAGIIAFIPLLFPYVIDEQYNEAYAFIPLLIVAAFLNSVIDLYNAIYIAQKETARTVVANIVSAFISVAATLALVGLIGLYAAPISMIVMYVGMIVYRHHDTRQYVALTYEKRLFFKVVGLYAFTIILYYHNSFILNIVNAAAVTVTAVAMNRSLIKFAKEKLYARFKKPSPDQEVTEQAVLGP